MRVYVCMGYVNVRLCEDVGRKRKLSKDSPMQGKG